MIRINVSVADATVTEKETLTASRVGLQCEFTFSSEWDELSKIAVCEGAEVREVAMDGNTITIPPECMAVAGYRLRIGVMGISANEATVIPTIWAKVGKIQDSADASDSITENVTPDVVAQIMQTSQSAITIARDVAAQAASGAFDGADGENAEIVGATGTVDNEVGEPSVTITMGGTPTERSFNFAFHNMKGEQGEKGDAFVYSDFTPEQLAALTGPQGPIGLTGATGPQGPKGDKGDPGEGGEGTEEVFWAVYGTTTYWEIRAAYQAGKICACVDQDHIFQLDGVGGSMYIFTSNHNTNARWIWCNTSNEWGRGISTLASVTQIPAAASSGTPAMDGTASRGSSAQYARADHVHPSDTSKITAPSSPATGAFLVYNGSAWVAQTLATWQGGSY